jgi:hypothetical protein
MLLWAAKSTPRPATPPILARRRTQSVVAALLRQEATLSVVKRERWTEADIDALPAGEHDYFERKSGRLFTNSGELLGKLAKTISAMANSGGGHIILGVDDHGVPDGVPPTQGRTATRDWLEQKIPYLIDYPLGDFRVHTVERATPTRIPAGREVIVIDVGDSALAPHQCAHGGGDARKYTYYYRQAGRSEPAPHFYLELLRQRLVSPVLTATPVALQSRRVTRPDGAIFIAMELRFRIENVGRVAAYKWALQLVEMSGYPKELAENYRWRTQDFPPGVSGGGGIRLDDTILPGGVLEEIKEWGILVRPALHESAAIGAEIERMILPVTLGYRLATETSPGEVQRVALRDVAGADKVADYALQFL